MSDELPDNLVPFPSEPDDADPTGLVPLVEALLFAAGEPLSVREICGAVEGLEPGDVRRALAILERRCAHSERGVRLARVSGGWQLQTDPRFADAVVKLRGARPQKLSQAALEVLSVVAYQQPATKSDVDGIRGVDSGGVLRSLMEKGLIRVCGRREEPGRPLEYATTPGFLELFSLPDLSALPTLAEREELERDRDGRNDAD